MVDDAGDLQENFPTRSVEQIALAALSLAIDAGVTDFENRSTNRETFEELMADFWIESVNELWKIRRTLEQ